MTISVTNIGTLDTSSSSGTISSGTVPVGATIIVIVGGGDSTTTISVSDNINGAYTNAVLVHDGNGEVKCGLYYFSNSAALSGDTITISGDNSGFLFASAVYATGLATSSALDIATSTTGDTTTFPSLGSGTPSVSGELFIAAASVRVGSSSSAFTEDTTHGWATPPNTPTSLSNANPDTWTLGGGSQVNSGSGAITWSPTFSNYSAHGQAAATIICSFKPQVGPAPLACAAGSYSITGSAIGVSRTGIDALGSTSYVNTGSATHTFSPSNYVPAGSGVVISWYDTCTNDFPWSTITDSQGNTYTQATAGQPGGVTSDDGGWLMVFYSVLTTALTTSNTISLNVISEGGDNTTATAGFATGLIVYNPGSPFYDTAVAAGSNSGAGEQQFTTSVAQIVSGLPNYTKEVFVGTSMAVDGRSTETYAQDSQYSWKGTASGNQTSDWGMGAGYLVQASSTPATETYSPGFISGYQAGVSLITGFTTTSSTSLGLAFGVGTYTITGDAAALLEAHVLKGAAGSYAITGDAAATIGAHILKGAVGSYSITGSAALLQPVLPATVGSYTISGSAAALLEAHILNGAAGSYSITGYAVAPDLTFPILAGSYSISGDAAALLEARILNGAAGSYSITGDGAALLTTALLALGTGSYAITGDAAALLGAHVLAGAVGSYTVNGNTAALLQEHVVNGVVGSYSITGDDALLEPLLLGLVGAYSITGDPAALLVARFLNGSAGSYSITGDSVDFFASISLRAAAGIYTINGAAGSAYIIVPEADFSEFEEGQGQGGGSGPPPPAPGAAEDSGGGGIAPKEIGRPPEIYDLFRTRAFEREITAGVPPLVVAERNLTTQFSPGSRPVVIRPPPRGKPQ